MADDLYEFLMQHNIVDPIVLGHSMGGKTAMQFAMNYPSKLTKLIVADIAPKPYPVHHTAIIEGMLSLNFEVLKTRKEADVQLSKHIHDVSTRQFILKNLYWVEKEKLAWRFNLKVIARDIELIGQGLLHIQKFEKPTLFLRGIKSNYITEKDYPLISEIFTESAIESIDSGHWLHAEKPEEFLTLVRSFSS
jgi:pimeloyl-ACP methyl ester carboxylesterase